MRIYTIVFFFLGVLVMYGQNATYEVFDVKGAIQIKHRGDVEWSIAKKGFPLGLLDSVHIETKGAIKIVDFRNNAVYLSNEIGYYRVKDIRDAAKEQSTKVLAAVWEQIKREDTQSPYMKQPGATTRGLSLQVADSIAQTIAYVGKQLTNNAVKYTQDLTLKTHISGEEIYFAISNSTTRSYCVNVVLYNKESKKASLCYVINPVQSDTPYILLPANKTIELPMWRFTVPSTQEAYLLFATENSYDSNHLQHLLQNIDWETISEPLYQAYKIAK